MINSGSQLSSLHCVKSPCIILQDLQATDRTNICDPLPQLDIAECATQEPLPVVKTLLLFNLLYNLYKNSLYY